MKFDKFIKISWLVIVVVALVLFYLYIQSNATYVTNVGNRTIKINKITGSVQLLTVFKYPTQAWMSYREYRIKLLEEQGKK